jgi:hypothetical protein
MTKLSFFVFLLIFQNPIAYCADLDGGIPSGDEAISDELQVQPNVAFIKRNAKAKANSGTAETNPSGGGVGNITSTCTKNCTIVNSTNNKGATSISQ